MIGGQSKPSAVLIGVLVLLLAGAVWWRYSRTVDTTTEAANPAPKAEISGAPPQQQRQPYVENKEIVPGIEVLLSQQKGLLAGKRCGLITNTSAVTRQGVLSMDALFADKDVNLVALFAPEHGLRQEYQTSRVRDTRDPQKKIPVHSLYGKTLKPSSEQLQNIDVLIFDIQDVGMRFYTYIWTLSLAMEAAAEEEIEFVVLDRPNPLGGLVVEGPVLAERFSSFVGRYPIPTRHGMTVAELALLFNDQFMPKPVHLHVVKMRGWTRDMWFDNTDFPWRKPSPGIYTLNTAIAYGATCFFEGTNVSEGRGTDTPFELVGAPWIDGKLLAQKLNALDLPGVEFEAAEFRPKWSKHKGAKCEGVFLHVVARAKYRCVLTGTAMLCEIHRQWRQHLRWTQGNFIDLLAGTDELRKSVTARVPSFDILASWEQPTEQFKRLRSRYLLYPERTNQYQEGAG